MSIALLKEGFVIMVIGMGTVFIFLTIMIYVMKINNIILNFINKYCPEEIPEVKTSKKKSDSGDEEIALAIACAIHQAQKV